MAVDYLRCTSTLGESCATLASEYNMKISNMQKITPLLKKLFLPWVALYVFVIGGAVVWASNIYKDNNEFRLPSGEVELLVSKTQYQLGETIEFSVINHFPVPIFVTNNCPKEPLDVYQWKNETWVQLHDVARDNSECYSQERNVEIPSESARSYNFNDWPNLFNKPGVYRMATKIDHSNSIPFQDFVILEPAQVVEVTDDPIPLETETILIFPPVEELPPETYIEEDAYEEEEEYHEREDERDENDDEHEDDD